MAKRAIDDDPATCWICQTTDERCPRHAGVATAAPAAGPVATWLDRGLGALRGTWVQEIRTDAEVRARAERAERELIAAIEAQRTLIATCVLRNDGLGADEGRARGYALLGRLAAIQWVLRGTEGESAVTAIAERLAP